MTCADFENLIALNVTGDLPVRQAAQVQAHLNECESCRALAEDLCSDLQWLQAAHREPADRAALHQVRVGVMRRLESGQGRSKRRFGGLSIAGWRWQWIAVPTAVAFFCAGIVWRVRTPAEPQTAVTAHPSSRGLEQPSDSRRNVADETAAATALRPHSGVAAPSFSGAPLAPGERHARRESLHGIQASPRDVATAESGPETRLALDEPARRALAVESGEQDEGPTRQPQAELFLVRSEEPEAPLVEAVRVRMPTSNPGIVVYWLMDEKDKGD